MRQLAEQKPVLTRDLRILVEWLARGKYPISICPNSDIVAQFVQVGAPVKLHSPKGGSAIATGFSIMYLFKKAPHPNAAKLFINWVFTKEAQTIWSRAALYPSLRLDVPTDDIEPQKLLYHDPEEKFILLDEEWYLHGRPGAEKKILEIFGPLAAR